MLYSFRGREPRIGKGSYVSEHALLIGDVKIGRNCYIGHGVILRGDYGAIEIGPGTAVEEGVVMHAPPDEVCLIGKKVTVGHGAVVHARSVGDLSVIGMGSVLSIYSEVGEGSIIAEACVVKMRQKIPAGVVAAGNPASIIRDVRAEDREFWDWGKQLYIDLAAEYLKNGMIRVDFPSGNCLPGKPAKGS